MDVTEVDDVKPVVMDLTEADDFKPPVMDITYEEEQKMDDDLDYAIAYCLETDFEEDPVPENMVNKSVWPELKDISKTDSDASSHLWKSHDKEGAPDKEQDSDYMLALELQKGFDAEFGSGSNSHGIASGTSDSSLFQKGKRFKAEQQQQNVDYMLALKLQAELVQENDMKHSTHDVSGPNSKHNANNVKARGSNVPASIVDPEWEVLDPIPDIHSLFLQFSREFFWGALVGVEVRWSPRMTLCAGVCCYEGRGGLCSVRLSQPLLKYRPRRDLVETLLHEMIHAYLFVTHNNKDHDAHGPEFLKHMHRINKATGTRITVYHSFHDEVDLHRKHWWKCNGPCQYRSPFFGIVKRAMNRAPSPRDPWWPQHKATCGGTYIKVKEPESSAQKNNLKRKTERANITKPGHSDIRDFFSSSPPANKENQRTNKNTESLLRQPGVPNVHTVSSPDKSNDVVSSMSSVVPFSGKGYVLGTLVAGNKVTSTAGSHMRNSSSTRAELLGNQVTNVPSLGVNFLPHRKGIKNTRTPVQKKSPLPGQSVQRKETKITRTPVQKKSPLRGQSVKRHPGSVNTSNKTGTSGTSVKFSAASGSRTIVIPKNSKAADTRTTVENSGNLPAVPFKGKGVVLGGGPSIVKEEDSKFSSKTVVLPSASSVIKEHSSRGSLDHIPLKPPGSKGNSKSKNGRLPSVKKEASSGQTKINTYAVSPEGKKVSSFKSENGSGSSSGISTFVKCPTCGSIVKDFNINAHLDICLQKYS